MTPTKGMPDGLSSKYNGRGTAAGILLLSLPWRLADWPSTALGALKAYLAKHGQDVQARHLHLEVAAQIGVQRYERISQMWDLGDVLYSCMLEPGEQERLLDPVVERLRGDGDEELAEWASAEGVEALRSVTDSSLHGMVSERLWLVGITVGALQLASTVYAARWLRRRFPHVRLVVGGGGVVGEGGRNLLAVEPAIDAVVDGEGEETLLRIARLGRDALPADWGSIPNLWLRTADGNLLRTETEVLPDLDRVAMPDYADYFDAAEALDYPGRYVTLPVEGSRGCHWEHRCGTDELRGCTFCGIFRTSPNYREKTCQRIVGEMDELVRRHRKLKVAFVDAYLPRNCRRDLLSAMSDGSWDLLMFCELRADIDEEIADLLAEAGTWKVQLGVESFHTAMLAQIEKGTRAIDNVYCIRLLEERGIRVQYNLITHYPGIPRQHVEEMIERLPRLFGLRPPNLSEFYLDRSSRVYQRPEEYGLTRGHLDHLEASFLPSRLAASRVTQWVPFRLDPVAEEAVDAWEALKDVVARWTKVYRRAVRNGFRLPLSYRRGRDFVQITDCRSGLLKTLTIDGDLRDVFLACDKPINEQQLDRRLPFLPPERIHSLLETLEELELLFRENRRVVALPAREGLPSGAPRRRPHVEYSAADAAHRPAAVS